MSSEVVRECGKQPESCVPSAAAQKKEPGAQRDYFVHESAYVDPGCCIGVGTKIGHFSHIMGGARIGNDCFVGQNVFIAASVVIGDRVKIENGVSICDGVVLEEGVYCEPSVIFTPVVNPRSEMARRRAPQRTLVRRGATLGANSTVLCGCTIGEYAAVGAGSVVTADLPPHALVAGAPAKRVAWICRCGGARLGLEDSPITQCFACKRVFAIVHGAVRESPPPGGGAG